MKRLIPLALLGGIALVSLAATCVVRNESLTEIDERDVFAGEMHNESGVDILFHEFRVAFIDDDNDLVETRTVQGCLRSLQDGAYNIFAAPSTRDPDDTEVGLARLANFDEDPDFEVGETEEGDFELSGVTAVRNGDTITVQGTITNNDSDELENPAVCAVVYDGARVVNMVKDEDIEDLEDGDSDTFSITVGIPDDGDAADDVDVWADGLEDGIPVEPASEEGVDITAGTVTPGTQTPTTTASPTATATP